MNYKYLISFDNSTWQDISSFINSKNTSIQRAFFSSSYESSTNVLNFSLSAKQFRNSNDHADLVISLIDYISKSKDVYVAYYIDNVIQFKGTIDKRGLSQAISGHLEEVSITCYDFTYLLNKNIETSFEYPEDFTVDELGWYFFKANYANTEKDILVSLFIMAGFSVGDIDFENSSPIMRLDEPTEYRMCRHIAYDSDDARTYRDLIDTILHENLKVLSTTRDGRFVILDMYQSSNSKAYLERNYLTRASSFDISLAPKIEDGIELTWSTLNTMKSVRVFDGNLGGKINETGTAYEGGFEMVGGSYYPETSDIEEVWQEYSSSWLDRPYYTKASRLQNKDLSLLSAKNIFYEAFKDDGIELDTGYPYAEALKAMFRFKNTTDETKVFNLFAIYGDCLFRYKINTYNYPTYSKAPETYESEFIYTTEHATEYALIMAKMKDFGIMQYSWAQMLDINEGEIWHINPRGTKIDTDVIITSVTELYSAGIRYYKVKAQGFGDYTSDEIRKRSTNIGATTGNIGKDGSSGSNAIIEYAKNSSLDTPPDVDTVFLYGEDVALFFGEYQLGIANWKRTAPPTNTLEDNEYIWQRNSV